MKITVGQLRRVIAEEVSRMLSEAGEPIARSPGKDKAVLIVLSDMLAKKGGDFDAALKSAYGSYYGKDSMPDPAEWQGLLADFEAKGGIEGAAKAPSQDLSKLSLGSKNKMGRDVPSTAVGPTAAGRAYNLRRFGG